MRREIRNEQSVSVLLMIGVFLAAYYIPWSEPIIRQSAWKLSSAPGIRPRASLDLPGLLRDFIYLKEEKVRPS